MKKSTLALLFVTFALLVGCGKPALDTTSTQSANTSMSQMILDASDDTLFEYLVVEKLWSEGKSKAITEDNTFNGMNMTQIISKVKETAPKEYEWLSTMANKQPEELNREIAKLRANAKTTLEKANK